MSGACLFRCYFNPRSPCGERLLSDIRRFGPTYFNPRSPCGERLCDGFEAASDFAISIHAPRVGSDRVMGGFVDDKIDFNPRSPCGERLSPCINCAKVIVFQSTLPVWGATAFDHSRFAATAISIHAPRVGSDPMRSPHFSHPCLFQSTLPVWGATLVWQHWEEFCGISIHAPRVGSDPEALADFIKDLDFNPRSPCGERQRMTW